MSRSLELDDVWMRRIKEQLSGVRFGQLQITVHNGQIVQIDRTERIRHDKPAGKL